MPELPEVETTLNGISPYVKGKQLNKIFVRNSSLRWPVPSSALKKLQGQKVESLERRAKYILLHTDGGSIMLHLGMSGSLRVLPIDTPYEKHDHLDFQFDGNRSLRLNDPRRFGCCLVLQAPCEEHKLLRSLGPEPLTNEFDGDYLFARSRGRSLAVKNFVMDGKVVVGVGNIYASESLFLAGIRPTSSAGKISRKRYQLLAQTIKRVLENAIRAGGTTLNDFIQVDGQPGYFSQELQVYGRTGKSCRVCAHPIKSKVIGQRSTFYCTRCQS